MRSSILRRLACVTALTAPAVLIPQLASADPVVGTPTGRLDPIGYGVHGTTGRVNAGIILVETSGGPTVQTYCIELEVHLSDSAPLVESDWDHFPGPTNAADHRAQITWVVQHSYPVVELDTLSDRITASGETLHDGLSEREAVSATQAAIWHYSDDFTFESDPTTGPDDADVDVVAAFEYLTGPANEGADTAPVAFDVDEVGAAGSAGSLIGPFRVETTAPGYSLDLDDLPAGARVTDAGGADLDTSALSGESEFFVYVPPGPAGSANLVIEADTPLPSGQIMVNPDYATTPTQSLVVVGSPDVHRSETVEVSWAEATVHAGEVSVDGEPIVGETLTATADGWKPASAAFEYVWLRDGEFIEGADAATHVVTEDDRGHDLTARVSATADGYRAATADSDELLVSAGELRLSESTAPQGDAVTVSGSGFAPNTTYDLELHSDPAALGSVDSNAAGAFTSTINVPDGTEPGRHEIVALAPSGVSAASTPLTVAARVVDGPGPEASEPAGAPVDAGPLPWAGGPGASVLPAAVGALTVGIGLLVTSRSRGRATTTSGV